VGAGAGSCVPGGGGLRSREWEQIGANRGGGRNEGEYRHGVVGTVQWLRRGRSGRTYVEGQDVACSDPAKLGNGQDRSKEDSKGGSCGS